MTLLLLSLSLALAAAGWVIRPILIRRAALLADPLPGTVLDADAGKRAALASLHEVEYDYAAGKLDEADYRALKDQLSREALDAMRAADRAHREFGSAPEGAAPHDCGFANPAGSRFCAGCGERLG